MPYAPAIANYHKFAPVFKDLLGPDWSFVQFEDAGDDWAETGRFRCHCGQPLRYRYTLRYDGPLETLCDLTDDERVRLIDHDRRIYFGETCFHHKILGLSGPTADRLENAVHAVRKQLTAPEIDPDLERLLAAQKHLIELLLDAGEPVPQKWRQQIADQLPLSETDGQKLTKQANEWRRKRLLTADGWIPTPQLPKKPEPLHRIYTDSTFEKDLNTLFSQLPLHTPLRLRRLAWKLAAASGGAYGLDGDGKPAVYEPMARFVKLEAANHRFAILNPSESDLIFQKLKQIG